MNFNLTYGNSSVSFEIDEKFLPKELPFIAPRKIKITPNMTDIEGSIKRALENPVKSKRLLELVGQKRAALIVSDEFRAGQQELIIKCMLEEIASGKPREVWIFCATGSHDPKIYASKISVWAKKYAEACKLAYRVIVNDCTAKNFINVGRCSDGTEVEVARELLMCDVRAYGHEGKHHYMNGYSCIDKQLLPGLSSKKTIEQNHKNALDDVHSFGGRNVWASDASRRKNPFSLGCFEAREIADYAYLGDDGKIVKRKIPTFGLDMISDTKHVYWASAGGIKEISYMMTKEADRLSAFEVEPVPYVVVSPGIPPACQTIYGTQNCFDMALSGAIKDGGEALVISPCDGRPDVPEETRGLAPDDKSKKLFYNNLAKMKNWPVEKSSKWIAENFELYLWKTDRVLKLMNRRKIKIYLYSTLPDEKVEAVGFIPVKDIQSWINERCKKNAVLRVIDDGNKILVMPKG